MTEQLDIVSLISSIASLVLAVVAIALAIVFFVLASQQAAEARAASNNIEGAVSRLELLFNRMYSDTFSIVKKTMDDMSSHIWRKDEAAATSSAENEASSELLEQLAKVSSDLGLTQEKVAELQSRMDPVVRESVNEIASKTPLRFRVLRYIQFRASQDRPPTFSEVVRTLSRREEVAATEVANILFELRAQGRVAWDNDEQTLAGNDLIRYIPPSERAAQETVES